MVDTATWEEIRKSWPGVVVERNDFEAYVAIRLSTPKRVGNAHTAPVAREEPAETRALEVLSDLYLAFACGQGNEAAIKRFTERFAPVVERVRQRFGTRAPAADEILADVHERLFVPREGRAPRITEFAGQSSLAAWLKVVTARLLLNRIASMKTGNAFEDSLLETLASTADGPERLLARAQNHAQFRALFAASVRALMPAERRVLRLVFVEQFTIDDLASLYEVHRTTASRRIQQATRRLSALVRKNTRAEFGMTESEYERWCESVQSGLELSIKRYLAPTASETGVSELVANPSAMPADMKHV